MVSPQHPSFLRRRLTNEEVAEERDKEGKRGGLFGTLRQRNLKYFFKKTVAFSKISVLRALVGFGAYVGTWDSVVESLTLHHAACQDMSLEGPSSSSFLRQIW